ncbi:MAG: DegT/DnrJ/EryC1/StrS family aminotransferase [Myxococcales bacterium]|nr:DegT/DnrJ/EryC1/StrS family aminotransferase [Myxococcales bacterium]
MASRTVPLVDLGKQHAALRPEIDAAIAGVIDSGRFILGPEVATFEEELAQACDAKFTVGVSSGTDALLLALMALGVGPGDEVVTSAFTFFATAGVIARLGAKPVFADIEEESFNLDPSAALAASGSQTTALMPVNLYGRLASLPKTDIPIIEDAAQSVGCGTPRGLAAGYSFFPTKNVGALGDAGAVATNDADFADKLKLLRTHGGRPKYFHEAVGGNFRIDALQAAVLRIKLRMLEDWNQARRANAARYSELFAGSGVEEVKTPQDSPEHIYHQYTICVPKRDELRTHLKEQGIATEIYYPQPLHLQECFSDLGYKAGSLPNTEKAAEQALSLPVHQHLDADDQEYVTKQVAAFYGK